MSSRPRLLVALLLLFTAIVALTSLFTIGSKKSSDIPVKNKLLIKVNCPDKSESCLTAQLLKIQKDYGSKEALNQAQSFVKENPTTVSLCHSAVHSLGISAYATLKSMDKVFKEGSNICSWAFLHGAIIAAYQGSTQESMDKLTLGLCSPLTQLDRTAEGECYHGVGHAVMLVSKNFALAMQNCEMIQDSRGLTSCVQGAIMEYSSTFPTDPVGGAELASKTYSDCLALRSEQTKKFCVYSVGESNLRADGREGDVIPAWKRCQVVGELLLHDCAQGLGKAAPDQAGWTAGKASKVCNGLPGDYQQDCNLVAATTLATVLLNEKYVLEYCDLVRSDLKSGCLSVLPEVRKFIESNKK